MNLYIDIDGVLIHDGLSNRGMPVDHALEFLREVTNKYNCFWLTTHCRGGENHAPKFLGDKLPEAKEYIDKILPTDWDTWKTEAIDFSKDFRWIDDDVYESERETLARYGCSEKLISVNIQENPDQLREIYKTLARLQF